MGHSFDHVALFPAHLLHADVLLKLSPDQIAGLEDYMEDTINELEEIIQVLLRYNKCIASKQ